MKKALLSLTFDDGLLCQFERAVPVLDTHGFPATFFLVANTESIFKDPWAEAKGFTWHKISWSNDDIQLLNVWRRADMRSRAIPLSTNAGRPIRF